MFLHVHNQSATSSPLESLRSLIAAAAKIGIYSAVTGHAAKVTGQASSSYDAGVQPTIVSDVVQAAVRSSARNDARVDAKVRQTVSAVGQSQANEDTGIRSNGIRRAYNANSQTSDGDAPVSPGWAVSWGHKCAESRSSPRGRGSSAERGGGCCPVLDSRRPQTGLVPVGEFVLHQRYRVPCVRSLTRFHRHVIHHRAPTTSRGRDASKRVFLDQIALVNFEHEITQERQRVGLCPPILAPSPFLESVAVTRPSRMLRIWFWGVRLDYLFSKGLSVPWIPPMVSTGQ